MFAPKIPNDVDSKSDGYSEERHTHTQTHPHAMEGRNPLEAIFGEAASIKSTSN